MKLTDGLDGLTFWKVPRTHEKLTDVNGMYCGRTES